ncbi:unnamed protein product [Paramecium sonneborni]|uniref:Uncharacterized protein n=1 Tax=Paramecium sonneborni TaxID=65129 RepID=A0A8S1RRX6_9CILI|nr:unnamed protein product [Paramecium sonneborni]
MNIAEISYTDLEKLVQILVGNTLDLWNTQKNLIVDKVRKGQELVELRSQRF